MKHLDRRRLLRTAGLAVLGAGACSRAPEEAIEEAIKELPALVLPKRRFEPVKVSEDRIIRTLAGLRPFRPEGFVVREEAVGSKRVVHHYGHGGCGVTLSWGTAQLALEEVLREDAPSCAVIGCGAVGLATARLLQRAGKRVTIYTKDLPPETTSNIAGAKWQPFTLADRDRRTPEFEVRFERAARIAHRTFQKLVGGGYGVDWMESYGFSDKPREGGYDDPLADLYPDRAELGPGEHPFPYPYAQRYTTLFIDTTVYLEAVLRDFLAFGGKLVVRAFGSISEVESLPEPVVVNCTGLGARDLVGDTELTPVKGQLTVLLPQPEVDYMTSAGMLYMYPRRNGILLGGTTERGEWDLAVNEEAEAKIVEGHRAFFAGERPQ
jgi:D-amino-acid oxidase